MRRCRVDARERGFTLLELIVAAGIMALIAVFSWRGLDTLIREREAIAASQKGIDAYQRSFARLERDAVLAADVQLDDSGTMRLVAGNASVDGSDAATVEYRLVGGALTRSVVGLDAAPLVVLDEVATLSIEAWLPVPGGGSWVRSKGASTEPAQLPSKATDTPSNATGATAATGAATATQAATQATATNANAPQRSRATPPGAGQPPPTVLVASATGVRLSFARADGSRVTRTFVVGGS